MVMWSFFSAVKAEMWLFRSMDLSDLSKVLPLLRNNQAGIQVYWSLLKITGRKGREYRHARPYSGKTPLTQKVLCIHPSHRGPGQGGVCQFPQMPCFRNDLLRAPRQGGCHFCHGDLPSALLHMITDGWHLEGCFMSAADKKRSELLWVKQIWVIEMCGVDHYQQNSQASDLSFLLLGCHLSILTKALTYWATHTTMISPMDYISACLTAGGDTTVPLWSPESQPSLDPLPVCCCLTLMPDQHWSPAHYTLSLVFPSLGCQPLLQRLGTTSPVLVLSVSPEHWLYNSVDMFSLLRNLYMSDNVSHVQVGAIRTLH